MGSRSQLNNKLYNKDLRDVVDHKVSNNKQSELVNKQLTQSSTLLMEAWGDNSRLDHMWDTKCNSGCQIFKRAHYTLVCSHKGNCGDRSVNHIYWANDSRNQKCLAWVRKHLGEMLKLPSNDCSVAVEEEVNNLWCSGGHDKDEWVEAAELGLSWIRARTASRSLLEATTVPVGVFWGAMSWKEPLH